MFFLTLYTLCACMVLFILGCLWIMERHITYPSGDTYSLLRATSSLQDFFYVKNQYIIHWREDSADPGGSFFDQLQRNTYLLSLTLLKVVPEQLRLKAAQLYNILFFLIFIILFYHILKQMLEGQNSLHRGNSSDTLIGRPY